MLGIELDNRLDYHGPCGASSKSQTLCRHTLFKLNLKVRLMSKHFGLIKLRWLLLTLILFAVNPTHAQLAPTAKELVRKGTALMAGNKIDAAIESFTKAIELSPTYAEAYVRRGMARRGKGDLGGAIEDYEKAASIDVKSTAKNSFVAQAYTNRGFIRLNALDVGGAIADYTKAIDIAGDADSYYKRGNARLVNEDLDGAIADLDKALALVMPANTFLKALIYANRGMARHLQGREDEARQDFDESIRLNKGEKLILDRYLMDIETRIMLLRKRRAANQRGVT